MQAIRRSSLAKRVAITLIALYAMMLQGFVAAAAPHALSETTAGITCFQDQANGAGSEKRDHAGHALCCIWACSVAAVTYVAGGASIAIYPDRDPLLIVLPADWPVARQPTQLLYFAARGPPQSG